MHNNAEVRILSLVPISNSLSGQTIRLEIQHDHLQLRPCRMASKKSRMGAGWSSTVDARREPFKVVIHCGELAQIEQWVRRYPDIETGGDIFGLWSKDNTAVVQLVLGPGKDSRRTSVSFFQDAEYLGKAGSHLTEQYGVCHIGEWHSHHSLGLAHPSGGDQNTVWSNMPKYGFKRFIVFIANIDKGRPSRKSATVPDLSVGLGCFLFEVKDIQTWECHDMMQGSFEVIAGQGPCRLLTELADTINEGAESTNWGSEVTVHTVRAGSRGQEGGAILMYGKEVAKRQGFQHTSTKSTHDRQEQHDTFHQKAALLAEMQVTNSGQRTQTAQSDNKQCQSHLTVQLDPLTPTDVRRMWDTLSVYDQTFLERLAKVLNGQLVKETNAVAIQFLVSILGVSEVACRLVYMHRPEQSPYVLQLYLTATATESYDIKPRINTHESLDPNVQFVKGDVVKCVEAAVSRIPSTPPILQPTYPPGGHLLEDTAHAQPNVHGKTVQQNISGTHIQGNTGSFQQVPVSDLQSGHQQIAQHGPQQHHLQPGQSTPIQQGQPAAQQANSNPPTS